MFFYFVNRIKNRELIRSLKYSFYYLDVLYVNKFPTNSAH